LSGKPLVLTSTPLTGASKTRFYTTSVHGDVEALTDPATGDVTSSYRYTAYGSPDASGTLGEDSTDTATGGSADAGDPTKDVLNPYRYSAKRIDTASGGYDMGFRNYDPGLNTFLSRDMYNGALADLSLGMDPWNANRYAFAGGNPISHIELDGHKAAPASDTASAGEYDRQIVNLWIEQTTPTTDDPDELKQLFQGGAGWGPAGSGPDPYNIRGHSTCFYKAGCDAAYRHLMDHPDDVAGAKKLAATYCVTNQDECESYDKTSMVGSVLLSLVGGGGGARFTLKTLATAIARVSRPGAQLRRVGEVLESVEDVMANPHLLEGVSPMQVESIIGGSSNWVVGTLGRGRSAGRRWTMRELNASGTDYTGRYIQWSPGSTRHFGGAPYWKVSSGPLGTVRFAQ